MEAIANFQHEELMNILMPTREAFIPLLQANLPQISKTPKKTFTYGPTDRHQVDVYYPPKGTKDAPILFFAYGGGFIMGSRTIIPSLAFDNIGAFFAQRGIATAIADYRLVPTMYPEPVKDIRDAIQFVISSPEVGIAAHGVDTNKIYIAGHSAGAAHAMTLFLNESILSTFDRSPYKGAILISGLYANASPPFNAYYGPEEDHTAKTPFGLLRAHSAEKAKQLLPPRLFILHSEKDPVFFITMSEELQKDVSDRGIVYQTHTMKGHNHISPEVNLFSGEGEEWGEEVAKWIKA